MRASFYYGCFNLIKFFRDYQKIIIIGDIKATCARGEIIFITARCTVEMTGSKPTLFIGLVCG